MIVLDASATIEALLGNTATDQVLTLLNDDIAAPHLLDIEFLSTLRGLTRSGQVSVERANQARTDFADLAITRYETSWLSDRIWALRAQYTAYDASYIALAELLNAPLVTCDRKLDAGAHHATVIVVDQ